MDPNHEADPIPLQTVRSGDLIEHEDRTYTVTRVEVVVTHRIDPLGESRGHIHYTVSADLGLPHPEDGLM